MELADTSKTVSTFKNMHLLIYDADGRISSAIHEPIPENYINEVCEKQKLNYLLCEGARPPIDLYSHWYVDILDYTLRPRTDIPVSISKTVIKADNVDHTVLSNLPIPTTIRLNDEDYLVEDGIFEMSADVIGDYVLTISSWPHHDLTVTITAE